MKHFIITLIFLISTNIFLTAQGKFGKVTTQELKTTTSSLDEEAEAEFILNNCEITFMYSDEKGFMFKKKVRKKLKIYNKEQADNWTKVAFSLYDKESYNGFKAVTHTLQGSKVVTEKVDKKEIFKEKTTDKWSQVKFAFPNVNDGSILEWQYTITSPYIWNLDKWYFQYTIPVEYSSLKVSIPEYFHYQPHFLGYESPHEVNNTSTNGNIHTRSGVVQHTLDYKEFIYKNLPAIKEESYVYNINNFRNSVRFELASTKFPGGAYKNYTTTWESVARELMEEVNFGSQLRKKNIYKTLYESIASKLEGKSVKEKNKIILDFVKSKVKWNDKKRLFAEDGVKKALDQKQGNSSEVNLLLVGLLRQAGLNANPLVLSTTDNGRINYAFPSLSKLNYVIAIVEDGNKSYFMDATHKYSNINVLPSYCLNYRGFIIYNEGFKEISVANIRQVEMINIDCKINEQGTIDGHYTAKNYGHSTLYHRERIKKSAEEYTKDIQKRNGDISKEKIEFQNVEKLDAPLVVDFDFADDINIQEIGSKLFINPLLFLYQKENPFKKENRNYPVEIGSKLMESYKVSIDIPNGYQVEHLPAPVQLKLPNKIGNFYYSITQEGDKVLLDRQLKLNKPIYNTDEASILREMFLKIIEIEKEKIILSKKT